MNINNVKFKKIIPTDSQIHELYSLLLARKFSISHEKVPSIKEHSDFVFHHPYVAWFLAYKNESLIGSVYVQTDNSIGINLIEVSEDHLLSVIHYIKKNYKPLPSIKSVRRGEFFVNVAPENTNFIQTLKNLGKMDVAHSFII